MPIRAIGVPTRDAPYNRRQPYYSIRKAWIWQIPTLQNVNLTHGPAYAQDLASPLKGHNVVMVKLHRKRTATLCGRA